MLSFIFMIVTCALASNADPVPVQANSFRYIVYSKQNDRVGTEVNIADVSKSTSAFSLNRDTVIIVHGHRGSLTTSLNPRLKDAILESNDFDVVLVDWSAQASQSYNNAVSAVERVGKSVADLINALIKAKVVALNKLHLIGFDLGAHAVGFTGRALNGEVRRITGLNPSGSQWGPNSGRLTSTDAKYVEVIHTDGLGLGSYGVGDAIGHVDFYPNGGTRQPGCFLSNQCSHNRAWELMAASFTHNKFVGHFCENWQQVTLNRCRGQLLRMGNGDYTKLGTGIYRVNTGRTYPY